MTKLIGAYSCQFRVHYYDDTIVLTSQKDSLKGTKIVERFKQLGIRVTSVYSMYMCIFECIVGGGRSLGVLCGVPAITVSLVQLDRSTSPRVHVHVAWCVCVCVWLAIHGMGYTSIGGQ